MLDYAFGLQILTLADPVPPAVLSPREAEVAAAYATGQGYRDIAAALGISPHTARNHIRTIFRKLGIGSKLELAARLKKSADQ
ncbi:MAG: helix-turn-helix transcriptional regulator [Pararhodobacter sp.]|nr:helix-turn-helix transcriptional regulator [Pararhodobacter sp.]